MLGEWMGGGGRRDGEGFGGFEPLQHSYADST